MSSEEADERQGLTDRDAYALLAHSGLGGWTGLTLAQFGALSDRQILALLTVEWDDEGRLVPEREANRPGSLAGAAREIPSPEMLGLSEEEFQQAYAVNPRCGTGYLLMFFQVWANRGKSVPEIMTLWRREVG